MEQIHSAGHYQQQMQALVEASLLENEHVGIFQFELVLPEFAAGALLENYQVDAFFRKLKVRLVGRHNVLLSEGKSSSEASLRYAWVRADGDELRPRYHCLLVLNEEAYPTVSREACLGAGRGCNTPITSLYQVLLSALSSVFSLLSREASSLIYIPENSAFYLHVSSEFYFQQHQML